MTTPLPSTPDGAPVKVPGPLRFVTTPLPPLAHVEVPDVPVAEEHHRVFHLPEHATHAVVAIEQVVDPTIPDHVVYAVTCWEVDAAGTPTGVATPVGRHSIPHRSLETDDAEQERDIAHMTHAMLLRLVRRKRALTAPQRSAVKIKTPPSDVLFAAPARHAPVFDAVPPRTPDLPADVGTTVSPEQAAAGALPLVADTPEPST